MRHLSPIRPRAVLLVGRDDSGWGGEARGLGLYISLTVFVLFSVDAISSHISYIVDAKTGHAKAGHASMLLVLILVI